MMNDGSNSLPKLSHCWSKASMTSTLLLGMLNRPTIFVLYARGVESAHCLTSGGGTDQLLL